MQLVEFETDVGTKIWVNPQQIVSVEPYDNVLTDIYFHWPATHGKMVKGSSAEVAKRINEALKT